MQCNAQPWLDKLGKKKKENPLQTHGNKETSGKQKEFVPHTMEWQDVLLLVAGNSEH